MAVDTGESTNNSFSSSYVKMIQAIAAEPASATSDDDADEKFFLAGADHDK
jgi:hypothetical protein